MALYDGRGDRGQRLIRRTVALAVVLTVTLLTGLWFLAPPEPRAARYGPGACEAVALVDAATGQPVVGAEALALSPDGAELYLTAYDRRAGEDAPGGLYRVESFRLGAGGTVRAEPLRRAAAGAPFRPHGIALSPDGRRLALVNRTAPGRAQVEIGPLGEGGWVPDRIFEGAGLCRANGLDFAEGAATATDTAGSALAVTLDRADCTASLRDLVPGARTGRIVRLDGAGMAVVRGGLAFPNGIAGPFVAETRAGTIARPDAAPIALPGGPDNLWRAPDGRLLVALHPRLHLIALYLRGWLDRAPSRIAAVDPGSGAVEILFDDPEGALFPAATGAVLTGGMLIAGSVGAPGLLVCVESAGGVQ